MENYIFQSKFLKYLHLHLHIVFDDQFSFNSVIEYHERLQHDEEFLAIWPIAAGKKVKT